MLVKTIRKPGEKGTRKLVNQYGKKLVCVRYRYDFEKKKKYKTVELIISSEDWQPESDWTHEQAYNASTPEQANPWVGMRIKFNEKDLQKAVKSIGGYWDAKNRLWYAPEYQAKQIGLGERIVCQKVLDE